MVQTLEKTLKHDGGGNAGGNISDDERTQLAEWAALHGRISRLCKAVQRRAD